MTILPGFLCSPTSAFSLTGWQLTIKVFNHHSYLMQVAENLPFVTVAASLSNKPVSRQHLLIAEVWSDAYEQCCTFTLTSLITFSVSCGWILTGQFEAEAMVLQADHYYKSFSFLVLVKGEKFDTSKNKRRAFQFWKRCIKWHLKRGKLHPLGRQI